MADDKQSSGDDGFIRTESGVREAFDNAKGGISASSARATSDKHSAASRRRRVGGVDNGMTGS